MAAAAQLDPSIAQGVDHGASGSKSPMIRQGGASWRGRYNAASVTVLCFR
jgi:hypothetical protein